MKLNKLITFLRCPYCHFGKLVLKRKKIGCKQCGLDFEVIEGVPIMMKKENLNRHEQDQKAWFEKHYSEFSKEDYCLENWRLSMLERVFSAVKKRKIKTYLDIGCGATGYTAIEGAKRNGWLSFGADISLQAMLRAKSLAKKQGVEEKTGFVVCSAERLPFNRSLFEFISAISLLEHLEKDELVIKEVSALLKKKGLLYVCVPNTYLKMWPFLWPIYLYFDIKIGHKRHYSLKDLKKKMARNGLILGNFFYNGHLIKLFQIILEKLKAVDEKEWWMMENKDIGKNPMGIQLNAIFNKKDEGDNR